MQTAVIGSGTMGTGIAQVLSTAGHEVILYDNNPAALDRARAKLTKILNRQVEKGRMTDVEVMGILERIKYEDNKYAFGDTSMIIEAVIEDLKVKRDVITRIEEFCPADCIIATNTSSLSVASIAAACEHPERVVGLHFFNPAPLMALVEVVPAIQTDDKILTRAIDLVEQCGKIAVVAKDTPGFIVNRVARPFYGEALRILEEGIADVATIDWAMKELGGFRMGPFTLMDYIGNDINYTVTETVFEAFYYDPRYKPAFTQKRLSEAGYLGRKTGRGYYSYADNAAQPVPNEDKALGQRIVDRILAMLINEAADAVHWQVASAGDIDLAMTRGVNYPKGLLAWANEIGIQQVADRLDALYAHYHEDRYRCSPLLRHMAKKGSHFAV